MKVLGVFAKYWEPGSVKTRLAAAIGEQNASDIYRSFVTALIRRLEEVADRRIVVYSPADREREFSRIVFNDWQIQPQSTGDLGERLRSFFARQLSMPERRVVVIGSDSPTLPMEIIERAFETLNTAPVVLGPSFDGGYFLIGATGEVPAIFEKVDWGTSKVWPQTVERLNQSNTPFVELEPWYDVDDVDDLRRLDRELQDLVAVDDTWLELADNVRRILSDDD